MEGEMLAFAFRKFGFHILFPLRLSQEPLHGRIRSQRKGMRPGCDGFLRTIRSKLSISKHGVGIGRVRRRTGRSLRVGDRLARIPCSNQHSRVIDEDGGVVRLKTKSVIKVLLRLSDVSVIKLKLA